MPESSAPTNPLTDRILSTLKELGRDLDSLTYRDLIPVSELHNRGKQATYDLARLAAVGPHHHVLDVGCGIGGPARTLVSEFGCRVTGIDISGEFCVAARSLNELVGLSLHIEIRQADALSLPFEDQSFDTVWTQHASMNIADKRALFAEMHRVLKPEGRLALHDVLAGPTQPVLFPVPWALGPSVSFLATPDETRTMARAAGFRELAWQDHTRLTEDWWRNIRERASAQKPSPLSPGLVMGSQFPVMANNMYRNIRECRVVIVQALYGK